jgi:hypothetical protein
LTDERDDARPTAVTLRRFTWGVATANVVVFGLILPWARDRPFATWPWVLAALVLVWGFVAPMSVAPFFAIVFRASRVIGEINNRMLLALVFVVCFVPVGIVRRIIRRDPLSRRFDPSAKTYRISRDRQSQTRLDQPY